jgi:hypothetical protein
MSKFPCKVWGPKVRVPLKFAHAKIDGIYVEIFKMPEIFGGGLRIHTSLPSDITEQIISADHDWYHKCNAYLRPGERLHAELYAPGESSSYVKHALAEKKPLSLAVFACQAKQLSVNAPLNTVDEFVTNSYQLAFAPYLWDIDANVLASRAPPHGIEGWVFKNGNFLDWYKWKPVRTIDCVVLGFTPGEGKYSGQAGALRVGVYVRAQGSGIADSYLMQEIALVSGMTDNERALINEHDINRVVECAYQCVGSAGRLRHPRFVRWREDKAPVMCNARQDEQLQEYWSMRLGQH